ncbi:MAG: hypothetical protein ACJ8AI_15545 [Rhodopila sp.]
MIDVDAIKTRFDMLSPILDERGRRLFAASEAQAAGRGGILAVHQAHRPCPQHDRPRLGGTAPWGRPT